MKQNGESNLELPGESVMVLGSRDQTVGLLDVVPKTPSPHDWMELVM